MDSLSIPDSPSPDMLAILRLYLEKYDTLAEEDKRLYRGIVAALAHPPVVLTAGDGLEFFLYPPNVASINDKETGSDRKAAAVPTVDSQSSVDYEAQVKSVYPGEMVRLAS